LSPRAARWWSDKLTDRAADSVGSLSPSLGRGMG
jgi:hypothetical protein